jgi:hypothetical protein
MSRYVILLLLPAVVGVLIAAGVAIVAWLWRHLSRLDSRDTFLETIRPDGGSSPGAAAETEPSRHLDHRRIAS